MAAPSIESAVANVASGAVIVTCHVDAPPLKNHIDNPKAGWSVWINQGAPIYGNETPLAEAETAWPTGNRIRLIPNVSIVESDVIKVGFNPAFGDTFDQDGNFLTLVGPGAPILAAMGVFPGPLAHPMENLRRLLAGSSYWRNWVGAADAAAAKKTIYLIAPTKPAAGAYTTAELDALRVPAFAKISMPAAAGGGGTWRSNRLANLRGSIEGTLHLTIEAEVEAAYLWNDRDAEFEFLRRVGELIVDLTRTDEGLGYLVPTSIDLVSGPRRSARRAKTSEGNYFTVTLGVGYGSPL